MFVLLKYNLDHQILEGFSYFNFSFPIVGNQWRTDVLSNHLFYARKMHNFDNFFKTWSDQIFCTSTLYFISSWVKIRLHTNIQLPRLPASTLLWWGCDTQSYIGVFPAGNITLSYFVFSVLNSFIFVSDTIMYQSLRWN